MPRPASTPPITPEQVSQAFDLKTQGRTWKDIREIMGLTDFQVKSMPKLFPSKVEHPTAVRNHRKKVPGERVIVAGHPLPPGATTLPPLPSLLEPVYIIQNK